MAVVRGAPTTCTRNSSRCSGPGAMPSWACTGSQLRRRPSGPPRASTSCRRTWWPRSSGVTGCWASRTFRSTYVFRVHLSQRPAFLTAKDLVSCTKPRSGTRSTRSWATEYLPPLISGSATSARASPCFGGTLSWRSLRGGPRSRLSCHGSTRPPRPRSVPCTCSSGWRASPCLSSTTTGSTSTRGCWWRGARSWPSAVRYAPLYYSYHCCLTRSIQNDQMPEALALARRAHKLIKSTPQPTSAVTCAILDNLGTILGLAAQSTFDPTEQQKLQLSAVQMLEESLAIDRASPRSHYQLALILAEQGQLGAAKAHVKMTLKANKGHVAAWHLLVLILTAARDLEGAVKLAELGVRESVAALIPFSSGTHTGGMAKSNTFDALAMLANDQAQNGTWAPAEYDAVMAAVFDLRLAQVRVIEQVRGVEAAVAVIQEMFRWFKRVFAVERSTADPDAATVAAAAAAAIAAGGSGTGSVNGVVGSRPSTSGGGTFSSGSPLPSVGGGVDDPLGSAGNGGGSDGAAGTAARNRAESVRSTASAWSLATPSVGGVAAITLRIKHARKRTMLTAALTNASGSDSGGADGQLPSSSASGSRTGNGSLSSVRRGTATEYGGGGARARGHSAGSVTSLAVSETNSGLDAAVPDALRSSAVRAATLAKLWLRLAQVLLNNGQLGPVPSLLKEAANLAPGDPRVDEEIAAAEYALGDTAAAVARWHGLLARNPHHLAALVGLARVALEHGRSADAELLLDDVTRHAGRASVDAWYLLGRVCKAQRDPERALACFQRALDLERAEPVHPFADVPRLSLVTLL
ncbi:hypothetical protein BC828DRAFT_259758 [Blastocladiella britannica]|nr:hypothetical protein BC828DRAFT_259758 [Blastocladiella britannica]